MTLMDIAHSWLNTPYKENCAIKNIGADCIGFLEAVIKEYGIIPPDRSLGLNGLGLIASKQTEIAGGDILVFKAEPFHFAIYGSGKIIHAHHTRGVIQNTYGSWFKSRLLEIYRLEQNNG